MLRPLLWRFEGSCVCAKQINAEKPQVKKNLDYDSVSSIISRPWGAMLEVDKTWNAGNDVKTQTKP